MSEMRLGFPGEEQVWERPGPEPTPRPWDLRDAHRVLGRDHPRREAAEKVTGRARYSYDVRFPGLIYARFLGSPHASAKVKRVDLRRAKALPGVLHAVAYEGRTIRYAGQAVAGIAAETPQQLADALAAIRVDYDVRPHVLSVEEGRAEGAPRVKRGANVRAASRVPEGALEAVRAAHAEADVVVEAEYATQVQTHSCLETHGCVCRWEGERLTVWASTQGTFAFRRTLSLSLGIKSERITVITEHMGGGFGAKFGADAWDVFCAEAARATGRPCRYLLDRREEHLLAGNRPDSRQRCRFSALRDGTLMGAEVESYGTAGVGRGAGVTNPAVYRFRATCSRQFDVFTHAARGRAFRAPRHPQGFFALEGMLDELAERLELDPLELRRRNDPHPVRRAQWAIGAEAIGWGRRRPSGSQPGPLKRGLGCAAARWKHNGRPGSAVRCRIGRDGSVLFANGAQDIGTGTRTLIALVGAEELGLDPDRVQVRLGNTNDPNGPASGGSTTAPSLGPPVRDAAWKAKQELLEAVAQALELDPADLDIRAGQVVGGPRPLPFAEACRLLPTDTIEVTGRGSKPLFDLPSYAPEVAGVQFAEVEVDVELGSVRVVKVVAVQDCGLVVNPLTARSQINGGVLQGISYALFEERVLDRRRGGMLNPNLLDYKILGALDTPEIVAIPFSVANGKTSTGISSLGEPPTVPTAGAIANAVANAIGARVRSLPITPAKVLAALGAI